MIKMLEEDYKTLSLNKVIIVRYEGLIGKGINGVNEMSIFINKADEPSKVESTVHDFKLIYYPVFVDFKEKAIRATFNVYKRGKYDKEDIFYDSITYVIPENRILSYEIRINKN